MAERRTCCRWTSASRPAGDPDRNLTHLRESLLALRRCRRSRSSRCRWRTPICAAPRSDYARDAARSSPAIRRCSISCHLGLGPDGHTASLVPGDAVLGVHDADVALTGGTYQSRRRMTLTYPAINRARQILWVVTGAEKVAALRKLRAGDPSIPAGRVRQERAILLADRAAAGGAA